MLGSISLIFLVKLIPAFFEVSDCLQGYDYDTSDFRSTLVTSMDWVCDQAHNVPNIYTAGSAGSMVGTLTFSYIGDKYSRNICIWLATAMIIVCSLVRVHITQYTLAFLAVTAVSQGCYLATYQLPMSILVELSDSAYRGWGIAVTCFTWYYYIL